MTTDILHRILVVHPSDTPRQLLVDQLKRVGYRYVAAVTGARPALDILDHSRVDLVIAADKLDDMDVWAFVRTIRSGNLCPAIIPMIVVAANRVSVGSDTIAEELGVRLYRGEQDGPLETVIESWVKQQPTRTVLVIEDDLNVGEVVQSGLGPYYQVETALDGEAGLRRWCQRRHTLTESYNVAPTEAVLLARNAEDSGRELAALHWGSSQRGPKKQKLPIARSMRGRGSPAPSTRWRRSPCSVGIRMTRIAMALPSRQH